MILESSVEIPSLLTKLYFSCQVVATACLLAISYWTMQNIFSSPFNIKYTTIHGLLLILKSEFDGFKLKKIENSKSH